MTKHYIPPERISAQVNIKCLDKLWVSHLLAKKPPPMTRRENCSLRFYSNLPKNKAKLALLHDVGELNFRRNRKYEAMKKYGSVECLVPACGGEDSLEHVKQCFGYYTRWRDDAGPYDIIEYLVALEYERAGRFNRSLLNHRVL